MKRVLLGLLGLIGILVVGVLGAASMKPDQIHVERSQTMAAAPADVYPHLVDLKKYAVWNPFGAYDPAMKMEFSDPSAGVGARYDWSGNDQVGVGSLTITAVEPNLSVTERLVFVSPWESQADVVMRIEPVADGSTVIWSYDQPATFTTKLMMLVMDMDAMMGPVFATGLQSLQALAEADAEARIEAEAAAAAAAAPVTPPTP
jgi:hypothetical protein